MEYGKLANRIAGVADLNSEMLPGQTLVELYSDRRVLIEHHKGVIQYGSNEICVKVRFGTITVSGNGMTLAQMSKERLVISGCIEDVRLCRGG